MKLVQAILLLMIFGAPCFAQQSCPLQPEAVKNTASQISVSLHNISGEQIVNYHLGVEFQDGNGTLHAFPDQFEDPVKFPSLGRRVAIWRSAKAVQFLYPVATVFVVDATFADGTEWIDDGTNSCSASSVQE